MHNSIKVRNYYQTLEKFLGVKKIWMTAEISKFLKNFLEGRRFGRQKAKTDNEDIKQMKKPNEARRRSLKSGMVNPKDEA